MLLGAIADDFTGGSDLALTLSREGMAVAQYNGVPLVKAGEGVEAGVISLKSRSCPVDEAVSNSLKACEWLLAQGCKQIIFKYCSTFDSTDVGNIGPVAEALLKHLGGVALVCPAFPANGRSVYMGHLFVKDRLLSESGMENHPLTPMRDPDLRRVLQKQTTLKVGHLPLGGKMPEADLIVADAISESDLRHLGKLAASHKLITGGSGIALGLPSNFTLKGGRQAFAKIKGAGFVLSGSCSIASREQVKIYAKSHPALCIEGEALMSGRMTVSKAVSHLMERLDHTPMLYSSADPAEVLKAQNDYGGAVIAEKFEDFFGEVAIEMVNRGVKRIAIGGGETSGAVIKALEVSSFMIGEEIAPGVPALRTDTGLAVTLKSGNFGQPDFYERAMRVL
jgi:3-dehydrotetronate 4-kinase